MNDLTLNKANRIKAEIHDLEKILANIEKGNAILSGKLPTSRYEIIQP